MSNVKETSAPKQVRYACQDTTGDLGSSGHSDELPVPDSVHDPDLEFDSPPPKSTVAKKLVGQSGARGSTGNPRVSGGARRTTTTTSSSVDLSSESELREEAEPHQEPFTSVSPPSAGSWSTGQSAPSGGLPSWTPSLDPSGQFSSSGPSNAGPKDANFANKTPPTVQHEETLHGGQPERPSGMSDQDMIKTQQVMIQKMMDMMAVQSARTESELDDLREQLDAEVSSREADAKKADDALRNALAQAEKATQDRRATLDLFEHVQEKVQKLEGEKAGKDDLEKRPMSTDRNKDSYAHFCTKWIEHFPKFDPYRSETEIRY